MKALLLIALCIISVASTDVFLKAPVKKVSDQPASLIYQQVNDLQLWVNNAVQKVGTWYAVAVNGMAQVVLDVNQVVPNNASLMVNVTVNYGFPWTDADKQSNTQIVLSLGSANVSTTNMTHFTTVPAPVINATLNFTQNPKDNQTTIGTVVLFMNLTSEPDQIFAVTLTSLNFTRNWATMAPPMLTAPVALSVNNVANGTLADTGILLVEDMTTNSASVSLNLTKVNVTWVNDNSTDTQSVPLVFNASYNFPGTTAPTTSLSQNVAVTVMTVNSTDIKWDANNMTTIVINDTKATVVQNVSLLVLRIQQNVSNETKTTYQLQNFTLQGIQVAATIDETTQRQKLVATNISAVVGTGPKSVSDSLLFSGANDTFSYGFPNGANGKGAIVMQGTRNNTQPLWIQFTVNETYMVGNVSSHFVWTTNQTFADQIGDFTENTNQQFSAQVMQPFNVTLNQSGETDWFNVSYTVANATNGSQPYFEGWKFNLQNLTVSFDLVDGENAMTPVLTTVPFVAGTVTGNVLDNFNQVCVPTGTVSTCTLMPKVGTNYSLPLPNVNNSVDNGPVNVTAWANDLNVTYMYSAAQTLQPQKYNFSANLSVSLKTLTCFVLANTNDPLVTSLQVCGVVDQKVPKYPNMTVANITNMTFVFNTYQAYNTSRANLTQLQLLTTGVSVQSTKLSTSNQKTNTSQLSIDLPSQQVLVSNQTSKPVQNLNLSLQYNVSQTFTFNLVSLKDAKDNKTNTSTITVTLPFNYTQAVLQNILSEPAGQTYVFPIAAMQLNWTPIANSNQGYGAGNLVVKLGFNAQEFEEMTAPSSGLSGGAIAGIVIGCIAFIAILGVVIYCVTKKKDQDFYTKQNA